MVWMAFKKFSATEANEKLIAIDAKNSDRPDNSAKILENPQIEMKEDPYNSVKGKSFSLDSIGQQNEVVRFRVAEMSERLEELKSLQSDFSSILEPIIAMTDELPKAKIRISEVETLLSLEQGNGTAMRREIADLSSRLAAATNDVSASAIQLHHLETSLEERDAAGEELRLGLRDKALQVENLERRLFAETEQGRALQGENKALRGEAKSLDQALARAESELQDLREGRNLMEQDNQRLQGLSEEQAARLADLSVRSQDFEAQAEAARTALRVVEQQLANHLATGQKAEAQYEAEVASHRADRASLAMRLEAATNRLSATEQMLAQLRNQLRDRDEAGRAAERGLKETAIERVTLERRLESVQADHARQTERFLEMQRIRSEFEHRCEMLTKALAAKDAALEQATGRVGSLSDRIDHLMQRQETERADFETVNHRLIEELQHERSERKLAQGALDIARESRVALQKQHEALKRSARTFAGDEAALRADAPPPEPSNVRPFPAPPEK